MNSNIIWHIIYNLDVSMLLYICCFNDIYAANSEFSRTLYLHLSKHEKNLLFIMEHGQMQQNLNFRRIYESTLAYNILNTLPF